jgi:hypothetical protein
MNADHLILWFTKTGCTACEGAVQTGTCTSTTTSTSVSCPSSSSTGPASVEACVGFWWSSSSSSAPSWKRALRPLRDWRKGYPSPLRSLAGVLAPP